MRFIKELLCVFVAVIFQSEWSVFRSFDLLALISFYLISKFHWLEGVFFALLGGMVWDALAGGPWGLKSTSLLVGAFVIGFLNSLFFEEHWLTRLGFVGIGVMSALTLEWGFHRLMDRISLLSLSQIFKISAWTAFATLLVYPVLDLFFGVRDAKWLDARA
ncbi:MAG: hypothetical protein HYS08_01990 [Chlamydiae bacterium]|nr:hypothetical protein [Chlamydiota bacterium]MBI3266586.1 hypothetical protein [Chlamydiota bacterium]